MKKKFRDFLLILLSFAIFFELFFILFDKYYLQPKKIPDLLFQQINDLSKKVHHLRRINTDKKIMMNEFKQNNNYLIYDEFLKFDKKKLIYWYRVTLGLNFWDKIKIKIIF